MCPAAFRGGACGGRRGGAAELPADCKGRSQEAAEVGGETSQESPEGGETRSTVHSGLVSIYWFLMNSVLLQCLQSSLQFTIFRLRWKKGRKGGGCRSSENRRGSRPRRRSGCWNRNRSHRVSSAAFLGCSRDQMLMLCAALHSGGAGAPS